MVVRRLVDLKKFALQTEDYSIPCKLFTAGDPEFVVIGVHGFAGDKESSVLAALADRLCRMKGALLCFDFPAHGESAAPDACLRVGNCRRDLLCVVDYVRRNFPDRGYGLFATSFGGYITLLCSEELKDFRIILRAPAVTMARSFMECIVSVTEKEFLEAGGATCGFERKMFVPYEFYRDLLDNSVAVPEEEILIIHGTEDDVIPYEAVKTLAEEHPQVRLISVEGADHRFKGPGECEMIVEKSVQWFFR